MKITVIGASGNVGSCAAFSIAVHGLADELVLIDTPRPDMVMLQALDINTAVTGRDILVRVGDYADMTASDIVVVAAGSTQMVKSRLEVLPQNLPIIQDFSKKIRQFCPDAAIITASNPVCPLNYAMYRCSQLDRKKIIGYSYNDTLRFRMRLAEALGVASSRVEGTVIGEHGDSQVLLFSSVKMDGKPVTISDDIKQKIRQQVPDGQKLLEELRVKTGRTAAWTTAVGLTAICRAIVEDKGEMIPCSVTLDGEYDCHSLSMSVPTILGKGGVKKILEWKLPSDERELLNQSIEILKPAMKYVEELLHLC
ncbi:MAG: malate dehydrogenase [Dehalococcoidales bacterium]